METPHLLRSSYVQLASSSFLLLPAIDSHRMSDELFTVSIRRRLRFPDPTRAVPSAVPTHCNHRRSDGTVCGDELDARGHHAAVCKVGGGVEFGHDAIRDWLAWWITEVTGRLTSTEDFVAAWDSFVQATDDQGRPRLDEGGAPVLISERAKLDVSFIDGQQRRCFIDVVVATASSTSQALRAARASDAGAAARTAVRGKRARYRPEKNPGAILIPFAVEAMGRLSEEALGLLRSVVPSAESIGHGARSREIQTALQTLSVLVQTRHAELLLSAEAARFS